MRAKFIKEGNISPYDKIGVMMAQEMGTDLAWDTTPDGLSVRQKDLTKVKRNKKQQDPFKTKNLGHKFKPAKINESDTTQTMMNIRIELSEFLKGIVVPQSKGHLHDERSAALMLYDILKMRYKIEN